jgi:F0F1-type ATP synthase assembly protein I
VNGLEDIRGVSRRVMHHDDRLPFAKAYQRATRVVTIALGMVVPGLLGVWVDSRLGTRAVFTIVGFALGMTYGIVELVRMSRPAKGSDNDTTNSEEEDSADQ